MGTARVGSNPARDDFGLFFRFCACFGSALGPMPRSRLLFRRSLGRRRPSADASPLLRSGPSCHERNRLPPVVVLLFLMSRGAGPWSLAAVMSTSPFWSYDPGDTKEHPQESSESSLRAPRRDAPVGCSGQPGAFKRQLFPRSSNIVDLSQKASKTKILSLVR